MSLFSSQQKNSGDSDSWISISDLMAGLMVIFLFVAIIYIRPVVEQREQIRDIVVAWNEAETSIVKALQVEFEDDLPIWNAEIDPETLTVRFKAPEVLFASGRSDLRPEFQTILSDFFPRYIAILSGFQDNINEVRIDGHTSSDWAGSVGTDEAYFLNMALSQARTRAVLAYCLNLINDEPSRQIWARSVITANGLSSSRLILNPDDTENSQRSRRVEFTVRTNAKQQIVKVLETVK